MASLLAQSSSYSLLSRRAWDGQAKVRSTTHRRGSTRRSEEHTSELQSHVNLVCRLLLEKKKEHSKPAGGGGATVAGAVEGLHGGGGLQGMRTSFPRHRDSSEAVDDHYVYWPPRAEVHM